MYLKKIMPILFLMAMIGIFMGAVQPASATTTEIKAYKLYPDQELFNQVSIKKGQIWDLHATLHVNGGDPQWYRYIHLYIYDSHGNQVFNEQGCTWLFGISNFKINANDYPCGDYKMCFIYWGSPDGEWPRADKEMVLHVTKA